MRVELDEPVWSSETYLCGEAAVGRILAVHAGRAVALCSGVLSVLHGRAARPPRDPVLHFTGGHKHGQIFSAAGVNHSNRSLHSVLWWKSVTRARKREPYLGLMWFWDSVLQSFPPELFNRSLLGSDTSAITIPWCSASTSCRNTVRDYYYQCWKQLYKYIMCVCI